MTSILEIKQKLLIDEINSLENDIRSLSLKEEEYQTLFFSIRCLRSNIKHLNNESD